MRKFEKKEKRRQLREFHGKKITGKHKHLVYSEVIYLLKEKRTCYDLKLCKYVLYYNMFDSNGV